MEKATSPSTSMSFCKPPCAASAASALAAPIADEKTTRSCVTSVEEARRLVSVRVGVGVRARVRVRVNST